MGKELETIEKLDCIETDAFVFMQQEKKVIKGSLQVKLPTIRPPGSACPVFLFYVKPKTCPKLQNPKSKICTAELLHNAPKSKIKNPNPKSKTQNPKSEIQNPGQWGPHKKACYLSPPARPLTLKLRSQRPFSRGERIAGQSQTLGLAVLSEKGWPWVGQ